MLATRPDNPERLTLTAAISQRLLSATDRLPGLPTPGSYNVSIGDDPAFVWFRVAKVGTRTVFAQLREAGVPFRVEHAYDVRLPRRGLDDHFAFAFVRNPWDRLVSCWQSKVLGGNPAHLHMSDDECEKAHDFEWFVSWVADHDLDACNAHFRTQHSLIDLDRVDFVGRFEHFDRDLRLVLGRLGLPAGSIGHENRSDRPRPESPYTPALVDRVRELYALDAGVFGYEPPSS